MILIFKSTLKNSFNHPNDKITKKWVLVHLVHIKLVLYDPFGITSKRRKQDNHVRQFHISSTMLQLLVIHTTIFTRIAKRSIYTCLVLNLTQQKCKNTNYNERYSLFCQFIHSIYQSSMILFTYNTTTFYFPNAIKWLHLERVLEGWMQPYLYTLVSDD